MDVIINALLNVPSQHVIKLPSYGNFYHNLLSCLNYPVNFPPVADLLRRFHGLEGDWFIASPIHWEASHNSAVISGCGPSLQLSREESLQWFNAWMEFAKPLITKVHYHDSYTWLIQIKDKKDIDAKPVHTILNQPFVVELEKLDPSLYWQRFITECQMFFSSHPLNKLRPTYPINGLWFWGAGILGVRAKKPIYTDSNDLFNLANILSEDVKSIEAEKLSNDSIILLETIETLQALQKKLKNKKVNWFGNNLAYTTRSKNLLSRLWRS